MRYALSACHCRTVVAPELSLVFTGPCIVTGESYSVQVPMDGFDRYSSGAPIQDAFPQLPAEDREFLISGTSPVGWTELFGDGEDDDAE